MIDTRKGVPSIGSLHPAQRFASFSANTVGMRIPMIWPPRKRVTLTRAIVSERLVRTTGAPSVERVPRSIDFRVMTVEPFSLTDVALAGRNRSMPIEMLRHDITPVGMHYMLTHFDIPDL